MVPSATPSLYCCLPSTVGAATAHRTISCRLVAVPGTLDWVFAEYQADRRFAQLDPKTRRIHEFGMRLVGDHILKDGRRLGNVRLPAIETSVADALYEKLLIVTETDASGRMIERERRTPQTCSADDLLQMS